jgi:hypothetical protein
MFRDTVTIGICVFELESQNELTAITRVSEDFRGKLMNIQMNLWYIMKCYNSCNQPFLKYHVNNH